MWTGERKCPKCGKTYEYQLKAQVRMKDVQDVDKKGKKPAVNFAL